MIVIKKGREPSKLLEYRRQEFASYAGMPADIKQDVIRHLLSEQGYICAYCMKRIGTGYGKHRATIEHLIPQAISTEAQRLNYHNMVAVCWGNRNADSNEDKSRRQIGSGRPPSREMHRPSGTWGFAINTGTVWRKT